jgi:uncharacterized repeat protein (TIGR03803 family)
MKTIPIRRLGPGRVREKSLPASLIFLTILFACVVQAAQSQTFTVLYAFKGGGDGQEPNSSVVLDGAGNLYSVTRLGGSFDYGTVFEVSRGGQESVLHSFLGSDGSYPAWGLLRDSSGNLYGTTSYGGAAEGGHCVHGCGTVFKLELSGKETVLYSFSGGTDGSYPESKLLAGGGNLYGTTAFGGKTSCPLGCGAVYRLNQAGEEKVLYDFANNTDGDFPVGLVSDGAGNLYGTTYDGGTSGYGAIFELNSAGKLIVVYSFTGGADSGDPAGLIRDSAGNLYGTTYAVGIGLRGFGTVYKLDTNGQLTTLYTFSGSTDGQYPGGLVLDAKGNLYGAALGGGTGTGCYYGGCGTIFKLDTENNFTVLHNFTGADGELPNGLAIDGAGNLYGTALGGGIDTRKCAYYKGCGTVFKLAP